MLDEIKTCPVANGFINVMIPVENANRTFIKSQAVGIELSEAITKELAELAEQYGLKHPFM
jgi:LDH2 family malate/lactate/ureidoglycolate dehydrogenase